MQKAGKQKDPQLNPVTKSSAVSGRSTSTSTPKLDLSVKRGLSLGHTDLSASDSADSTAEDGAHSRIQGKILAELQRMGNRLDRVEDATAGATAGHSTAKSAHVVLMCEMERGSVDWFDSDRIDRIRRAHAQRHTVNTKQSWAKSSGGGGRPWFCKARNMKKHASSLLARGNKGRTMRGHARRAVDSQQFDTIKSRIVKRRVSTSGESCWC